MNMQLLEDETIDIHEKYYYYAITLCRRISMYTKSLTIQLCFKS